MTEHTPLPWTISKHSEYPDRTYELVNPDTSIADIDCGDNAEFICRAVNCHDDLLAALEEITRDLKGPSDFCKDRSSRPAIQLALETARAAIAKARKGE